MRFSDRELEIIKSTFAGNDELIFALRKHFMQLDMTVADFDMIQSFVKSKPEVQNVIRKAFLPTLDGNAPLHQIIDLWMTVDIKERMPGQTMPVLMARDILIKYLEQRLTILEGGKVAKTSEIKLNDLIYKKFKSEIEAYSDLMARNTAITHTEQQLAQFVVLAGTKEETIEELKERLAKNSTK